MMKIYFSLSLVDETGNSKPQRRRPVRPAAPSNTDQTSQQPKRVIGDKTGAFMSSCVPPFVDILSSHLSSLENFYSFCIFLCFSFVFMASIFFNSSSDFKWWKLCAERGQRRSRGPARTPWRAWRRIRTHDAHMRTNAQTRGRAEFATFSLLQTYTIFSYLQHD